MKQQEMYGFIKNRLKQIEALMTNKGTEYAEDRDGLVNFKESAAFQECTTKEALLGYWTKHVLSIKQMIKDDAQGQQDFPIEKWEEKTGDIILYMLLLECLVWEEETEKSALPPKQSHNKA
jgi:hypothetical protein